VPNEPNFRRSSKCKAASVTSGKPGRQPPGAPTSNFNLSAERRPPRGNRAKRTQCAATACGTGSGGRRRAALYRQSQLPAGGAGRTIAKVPALMLLPIDPFDEHRVRDMNRVVRETTSERSGQTKAGFHRADGREPRWTKGRRTRGRGAA
jgi:hypothetical protein